MVAGIVGKVTTGLAPIRAVPIGVALMAFASIFAALISAPLMRPVHIEGALIDAVRICCPVLDAACNASGPLESFDILLSVSISVPV